MADVKLSAVAIKKLWYCDVNELTTAVGSSEDLTGAMVYGIISDNKTTEIKNIHQDTWQVEESESSQDSYRNQLTGSVYRMGQKTMGEVTFNFTIGQYDYRTKAALLGGEVVESSGNAVGWKRARGITNIKKCFIAKTEDDQYCILPEANLNAREANTDGAIGLAVVATALEPQVEKISPEYWFDASEVKAGAGA